MVDRAKGKGKPVKKAKRKPNYQIQMPEHYTETNFKHAWDPFGHSDNIFIKREDPFTFYRKPAALSTDSIRGLQFYRRGMHMWEFEWVSTGEPAFNSWTWCHSAIGVATVKAPFHCRGDRTTGDWPLLGRDTETWGWDLSRRRLCHDRMNRADRSYPTRSLPDGRMYWLPRKLVMILNLDRGTLSFTAGGKHLGVAFDDLKGKTLYPMFSSSWDDCEVTMTYLNKP